MIDLYNKGLGVVALSGTLALLSNQAVASVAFDSYANINFSVESISVSGGGTYTGGVSMSGSFMRSGDYFPETWAIKDGDANILDNNPEITAVSGPVPVGAGFSHSFALSGNVSSGLVDLNQVGWYDLVFTNSALEVFDVTLNYSFEINTSVVGQEGNTSVSVEYYDDHFDLWSIYDVSASSAQPELSSDGKTITGQFVFTLNPFTGDPFDNQRSLYVDVGHTAYLSPAPVPVPAAAWLFVSGVFGLMGLNKRKTIKI